MLNERLQFCGLRFLKLGFVRHKGGIATSCPYCFSSPFWMQRAETSHQKDIQRLASNSTKSAACWPRSTRSAIGLWRTPVLALRDLGTRSVEAKTGEEAAAAAVAALGQYKAGVPWAMMRLSARGSTLIVTEHFKLPVIDRSRTAQLGPDAIAGSQSIAGQRTIFGGLQIFCELLVARSAENYRIDGRVVEDPTEGQADE